MDSPTASINARRGRLLAPIQTDFSKGDASPAAQEQRNHRPRPHDSNKKAAEEKVPLQPQSLKRQSSRASLRNIFCRKKSMRKADSDAKLAIIEEDQTAAAQRKASVAVPLPVDKNTTSTPNLLSSPATREAKTPSRLGRALPSATIWDPPPLFQAYPQAIKHAVLMTPCLSVDSILRINSSRRSSNTTEDTNRTLPPNSQLVDGDTSQKKKEEKEKKHSRKVSGSISKTEWKMKIYILVTSGYILQYAGEGNFDRLPEKIMQLGPKSVAFASDAIPGRHWVLQISQSSHDNGTVALDSHGPKALLHRFGLHGADARKSTRSFLMVHNSPEEMNSWIVAVRREIEALGGRKYVAESPEEDPTTQQLHNKPSFRYSVKRDPYRFPSPFLELSLSPVQAIRKKTSSPDLSTQTDTKSIKSMNRRSLPPRASTDAPSVSTTTTVTELDRLREHSRLSYVSGGVRTHPSSLCSSPPTSPAQPDIAVSMFSQVNYSTTAQSQGSAAITPKEKRQSMFAYSSQQTETISREPSKSSIRSAAPELTGASAPVIAPNFSVPFCNRRPARGVSASRTALPLIDTQNKSHAEPPSPDSLNGSPVNPARPPEPATPEMRKDLETQSVASTKGVSHGHNTPGSVSSTPHVSPKSSALNKRRDNTHHVRQLSGLSSAFNPQIPASRPSTLLVKPLDIGTNAERPNGLQQAPDLVERSALSSLSTAQPQLTRSVSAQGRMDTTLLPRGVSQSMNGNVRRVSSIATVQQQYQRTKVRISNSAMIGAAARPQTVGHLAPRKSLPDLALGPPSAPPPNCPLPAVPTTAIPKFQPAWRGDLVSQKLSTSSSQKSLDTRNMRSDRSSMQPDHISMHDTTQAEPRKPSLVNAY